MSNTGDTDIDHIAKALRSGPDTPEYKNLVENAIAQMKRSPGYYAALGRFVSEFSHVETTLHTALRAIAGVPSPLPKLYLVDSKSKDAFNFSSE